MLCYEPLCQQCYFFLLMYSFMVEVKWSLAQELCLYFIHVIECYLLFLLIVHSYKLQHCPSVFPRSMYFHVHIISILAAFALHRKQKPKEPSATSKTFSSASASSSFSSSCPPQCQPVHSNNNDKVEWKSLLYTCFFLPGSQCTMFSQRQMNNP